MPEIKQYTRTNLPNQTIHTQVTGESMGSNRSGELAMSQALGEVGDTVMNIMERRDKSEYLDKITQFKLENMRRAQELSNAEFPDNADLSQTYIGDLKERAKNFEVPMSMRGQFEQDLREMEFEAGKAGIVEQARRAGIKAKTNWDNTIVNATNMVALDPSKEEEALRIIRTQAANLPNMSPEDKASYLDNAVKGIRESALSAKITADPDSFLNEVSQGKHTDVENLDKMIKGAKAQKKANVAAQEKALIASREADTLTKLKNEGELMDKIFDDSIPDDKKILEINRMDFSGLVRDDWAVEARRMVTSKKEANAVTNSDVMADIVTRMYDVNAVADMNPKDYLDGVNNIRKDILAKRADGSLSVDDEKKLNAQMKTLTSAKMAEATNDIAYQFGSARKVIDEQLPPEMRGEAIRSLFYATQGQEPNEAVYKKHAAKIVDDMRKNKKAEVYKKVEAVVSGTNDDEEFLKSKGISRQEVIDAAQELGVSESFIINDIRSKLK